MTALLRVLAAIGLLTLGRKLFWLFVGLVGFEAGNAIATRVLSGRSETAILLVAIIIGVLGAVLAIVLQKVVIGIAGFLAGGYLLMNFVDALKINSDPATLIAFIVGGIIGALLIAVLFDGALIILSSLVGATTLVNIVNLTGTIAFVLIVILFIVGVTIQAGWWLSDKRVWTR